jgi:nicotinate phosphoribosyltransferase
MSIATLGIDAYQVTTLIAHAAAGRLEQTVTMSFFFRALPRGRNYVVACGLESALGHAAQIALDEDELRLLDAHPVIGPALAAHPRARAALRAVRGFRGDIDALPEGTLAFAAPGLRTDGRPFALDGVQISLYTPLVQVKTDLVRSKLIETPWLSRLNYGSMVASKAARVVEAARGKPVFEFGQRRTHPEAAIEASRAAWLAGCAGSSNLAAQKRYGVPASGTMDHFFVQAAERAGVPIDESERAAFALYLETFPRTGTMLVDTYDTELGLRDAVAAAGAHLSGVRLDSNVTAETVRRARQILDAGGARQARIFVSDRLDEWRVRELAGEADAFGVGENLVCSSDVATGVGLVAKLVVNGYGKQTMKRSAGSDKLSLPGPLQVYRHRDHDLIATADEPAPSGGRALLQPVWRGDVPLPQPTLEASRALVRAQVEALPPELRALEPAAHPWPLVISDALAARVEHAYRETFR